MEFRKYAAHETSELVGRLVTGLSEKVAGDLQPLRHALDTLTAAMNAALATQAVPDYRGEVAALAERLAAEATSRAEAASEQVRKEAQATIDQLRAELEAQSKENAGLAAGLTEARAQADRVALELKTQKDLTDAARAESAQARDAQKRVEAARLEIQGALENARREAKASAGQLQALKQTNDEHERACRALQAKLDAAGDGATKLRERAEAAERETERARAEAEKAAEAHGTRLLAEQADAIRQRAAAFLSGSLDGLLAMYLTVARGATIDDLLAVVVETLAPQFSRVALFRVQANHLEGVRQIGFDLRADISQVLIPRTLDSLVTQAVTSGHIEMRSGKDTADTSGMPLGGTPTFALALPMVIDGEALAVVYADDSGQADREFVTSEVRLAFAQLLQSQANPLLTELSAEAKALAELDEYATLLLTELEHTYAAGVKAAGESSDAERRKHLRDDIEYARRLYGQRAASQGPRAAALFERRLAAAVDAHSATAFGRDILAAIGGRRRAARVPDAAQAPVGKAGGAAS